ncbi:MAG: protein kinase [Eubacteriales bacterium]|nr:protein kinase [Eubacteriales bacterium]
MKTCYNCFHELPDSAGVCPNCGQAADLTNTVRYPHALPCGAVLNGRYIVGRVQGQGGFGITYVGQQYDTKQLVAIKEYFPDTMATRNASHTVVPFNTDRSEGFAYGKKQFLDEAKTLSAFLGSPNIVRVFSYFEENGTAYFAMEYVRGKSLRQYVENRGGRISWEETWDLLMPVLDALSEIHSKRIIHRDIKPDNIIITEDGSAKLIDFGAARYKHGEKSRSLTAILTPGYAPPEQYYTNGDQGPWTDVYALAATMYFCITGKTPPESIERSFNDRIEKPSSLGVAIPAYAEASLLRALSVRETDRFGSTYDFRNAVLEGKQREEKTGGVKSLSPDRNNSIFRETQKKAADRQPQPQGIREVGGQKPGESNQGSEDPQPRRESAGAGETQPRREGASTGGTQPRRKDASGGEQENGTKDQRIAGPVTRKKGSAGRPKMIILAAAIIVLIAVVSFVWSNSGRSSKSGSGTGGSGQKTADTKETGEQEESSLSAEDAKKEESGLVSRTSDDPMELTDTWEEIITAGGDGTYKEKYRIGDTKELDMGTEGIITMRLAAIDEDELADGSGKAPMTWVADELLQSTHTMNSEKTNEGGWEASEMRIWLRETVLPLMPEEVRNNVREVTKYSYSMDEYKEVISKDTIWIPSAREVYFSDQRDMVEKYYETAGVSYTRVFGNNESRIRSREREHGPNSWWLRSAYVINSVSGCFSSVAIGGNSIRHPAPSECGVVIGFCL